MLKVAGFAAQLEHYERAIKIYEEVCTYVICLELYHVTYYGLLNPIITMLF